MSIALQAASAQLGSGYSVDAWIDVTLQPILKLWQGVGGHSNFFFSEEDAREATGAYEGTRPYKFAETLWRLAQVQPNPALGYRQSIGEFVVDLPVPAAVGLCTANRALGSGSVFQYYIPDWEARIYRTGRVHRFSGQSY
ncbi:hypothetical protein [Paraliomyxa miuraensis]|uniref:hypothetical protein n=1 Tax=Paraliomyxa miuraensis TaxID=376150 RepID=UPI00225A1CE8|nr:hypothetical protein [Paraliomyxa miuraensis]MCX4248101.1 hypothetical protein [Paraliomyxa miuraensis]